VDSAPATRRHGVNFQSLWGRLVTTSGFGKASFDFANDRDITWLTAKDTFPAPDARGPSGLDFWNDEAGYLTPELILAGARTSDGDWDVLVQRHPMRLLGRVDYGQSGTRPGGFQLGHDRLTVHAGTWVTASATRIQRWEVRSSVRQRDIRRPAPPPPGQLSLFNDA
jgi:hypothetical protein